MPNHRPFILTFMRQVCLIGNAILLAAPALAAPAGAFAETKPVHPSSEYGTMQQYLANFVRDNARSGESVRFTDATFVVSSQPSANTNAYAVFWVEEHSSFLMLWPQKSSSDFNNPNKNISVRTDFAKNIVERIEDIPKNTQPGEYQTREWAAAFLLSLAKDGVVYNVRVESKPQTRTVTFFFNDTAKLPTATSCFVPKKVTEKWTNLENLPTRVVQRLLHGSRLEKGFQRAEVVGSVARLHFSAEALEVLNGTACTQESLKKPLETTLKNLDATIRAVEYWTNGKPVTEWDM